MLNCSEYWRRPETFFETWSSAFSKIKYVCPVFHQTFHSGQDQVKACITTEILCHQTSLASVGLWERFQCNIFFYMKLNKINLYIRWVIHCHSTSHWRPINIIVHQITGNSLIKIVIRLPIKKTQKLQWVGFFLSALLVAPSISGWLVILAKGNRHRFLEFNGIQIPNLTPELFSCIAVHHNAGPIMQPLFFLYQPLN